MKEEKERNPKKARVTGAIWGAILGILLGTAMSSALAPLVKKEVLRALLVEGVSVGIPKVESALGFFNFSLGFTLRFTLLSGFFMLLVGGLMLLLPFKKDN